MIKKAFSMVFGLGVMFPLIMYGLCQFLSEGVKLDEVLF
jgi:hypothetical protein